MSSVAGMSVVFAWVKTHATVERGGSASMFTGVASPSRQVVPVLFLQGVQSPQSCGSRYLTKVDPLNR